MSEFVKTTNELDRIVGFIQQLEHGMMEVEDQMHGITQAKKSAAEIKEKMEKFKKRADEKDKDKKMYGEAMVKRVQAAWLKYTQALKDLDEWYKAIEEEYEPIRIQRLGEAAAAEEKRKREEEQKAAEEAEKQRIADEEERKRKEEEDRKKAEEAQRLAEIEERRAAKAAEEERQQKEEEEIENQRREELAKYLANCEPEEILSDSLRLLQKSCSSKQFESTLRTVRELIDNVLGHPDEEQFKKIRKHNAQFEEEVGKWPGGAGCLYAIGFRESYSRYEHDTMLELHEPNVMEEYEAWKEWFDGSTLLRGTIDAVLSEISRSRYTNKPVNLDAVLFKR